MSLQNKQPESKQLLAKYWATGKKFHAKTLSFIKKYNTNYVEELQKKVHESFFSILRRLLRTDPVFSRGSYSYNPRLDPNLMNEIY